MRKGGCLKREAAPFYDGARSIGLHRKSRIFLIQCLNHTNERMDAFSPVIFVCTENAGYHFPAIKGNPCKSWITVIQKTGSKANAPSRLDIGKRCVVIMTVEVREISAVNHPLLHLTQYGRRAAAYHQRPPF